MAEQSGRQPFRFRLPWGMSATPTAPRPPPQPQTTQSGRPPFRPPGLAPPRPSSQPQAPTRSEPQPPSTARVSSQPSSPVKTLPSQSHAPFKPESRPASPIRTAPQSRVTSQPSSPSKTAPSQIKAPAIPEFQTPSPIPTSPKSRVPSQPPSPSRTTILQTPATTDSQPSSPHLATTPKSQIPLQPPSPSHTITKPQGATRTSSQPSSPSLTSTQPQRASQTPSSLQLSSRLPTKTSSQPPSPTRLASQLESAPQKASQDHSPLIQATQSPTQSQSPERPSASLNELASTKRTPSGLEVSERLRQIFQETERSSSKTHQPDLETKQTSGPSAVPIGPIQYSEPKTKPDEIRERMKPKMHEKEDISTILIEDERRQMTILELTQGDSGSNIQSRGQMGTSEDGKKLQKTQAGIHEKNVPAKVAAGEERKPIVPNSQNEKQATTEYHPPRPQADHSIHHKEIRDDLSRFAHKMSQKTIDENPVGVMTLAGENTGATMHLGSESPKRESSVHINRGYKLNQEDISEATTDGENSAKRKFNGQKTKADTACMTYINSNTQSANNSIMMNSSINEQSPGVHVVFTHYPDRTVESNRKTDSVEARKADFNITQSQKLTYEPTVRRRCLRGLLLESSDSDPDNPEKPRRHGCRYSCNEKQSERKNGIDY